VNLIAYSINPFCIVMDLAPEGNLHHLLRSDKHLSMKFRVKVAVDITKAMAAMHKLDPPMMHRDLKRQ
jgi:serine/threonine protein kinase